MAFPTTLDQYLEKYGAMLSKQASSAMTPRHNPKTDKPLEIELLRKPYEAQSHLITAGVKHLKHNKAIQVAAALGTGKTLMGLGIVHGSCRRGYRCLVFCPPHLTHKWAREIQMTVPKARVKIIDHYSDLPHCGKKLPRIGPTFWIVSNTMAKLGPKWKPVFIHQQAHGRRLPGVYCVECVRRQEKEDRETGIREPIEAEKFIKSRRNCLECDSPMYQWDSGLDRWPIATYIHKKLRNFFDFAIIDESHQAKSGETAIGCAVGSLAAGCKKLIFLSGTIFGGYAWHIKPTIFRINPPSLIEEGIGWDDTMQFNERYGRIERKVTEEKRTGSSNVMSKGGKCRQQKYVRPGVMPQLLGNHLLGNCVFMELDDIASNLPKLVEVTAPVPMDPELAAEYQRIEEAMAKAVKQMLAKKNNRALGLMITSLMGYPDHPYGWGNLGYMDKDEDGSDRWVDIVHTKDLSQSDIRNKERKLIEICLERKQQGRQVWVFGVMSDKRDVLGRLEGLLAARGLRVGVLRSSVPTDKREDWIAENAPNYDVCLSHPQLVETGLDLFDKNGKHNFPTLVFYLTGYNLFTMRQAAGRAWRIGQTKDCETIYLYYENTMQARAITLMAKKLAASTLIEGKFSSEGLLAMAGDEGSMEVALAKSLVQKCDDLDGGRVWERLSATVKVPVVQVSPPKPQAPEVNEGSWWKPRTGPGFPIQIMQVVGRFADYREAGKRNVITLSVKDIQARYVPATPPSGFASREIQKTLL